MKRRLAGASGRCRERNVSFLRHEQIYRSDVVSKVRGEALAASPRSHRSDEFAADYSLAVCSPAWPASASPTDFHLPAAGVYLSTGSLGNI